MDSAGQIQGSVFFMQREEDVLTSPSLCLVPLHVHYHNY